MTDQKLPRPSRIYWITRDSEPDGTLSANVDVWDARPRIHRRDDGHGVGVFWLDENAGIGLRYGNFPYAAVAAWGHAMPDTDHESICVEVCG